MTLTHHHLLVVCIPAWGHSRPGLAYVIKLLQATTNLTITFPTTRDWTKNIDDEIAKYIPDIYDPVRDRLRIIQINEREQLENEAPLSAFMEGLFSFCTGLFTSNPYQQVNGNVLSGIQRPDVCLLDLAFWDLLCLIRDFEPKVPILTLSFGNTTATLHMMGPEELGGKGDVSTKAKILADKTGKLIDEELIELYLPNKGQATNLIGLPKVYDYECYVKLAAPMVPTITVEYPKISKLFRNCDGVVTTSPRIFEPESNDAFKAYYEKSGRSYYVTGPVIPTLIDHPRSLTDKDGVGTFLDRMLQEHGERSVIYVSFGSGYWPLNPEATWKSFEIIHERQIPMILSHNNVWMRPAFPDPLRVKFEASDIVLMLEWAPQNLILGHKATAWFLTHCGQNSVSESLSHGIPMIAWPIDADQCVNAMYVGELKHNVGYELLEALQRDESKPLYRGYTPTGTLNAIENELGTILQKAFGPDGAKKRRNAEVFKEKISHLWDEDGDAQSELRRFLKDYGLS